MNIKHISFDFWDTLYLKASSNPNYKKEILEYFHNNFNFSPDEVNESFEKTKTLCDGHAEETMICVDSLTQSWHLLNFLGINSIYESEKLNLFIQDNLLRNPSKPLFEVEDLHKIKNAGASMSISCNTGLISGITLNKFLAQNGILNLFDFTLYSDEINYFKPSPFFAQKILNHKLCNAKQYSEILHIGDTLSTDGVLSQLTGMNFLHVNKTNNFNYNQIIINYEI